MYKNEKSNYEFSSRLVEESVSHESAPVQLAMSHDSTANWYQRVASHESISREYRISESRVISKSTSTSHESIGYDSWVTSQLPSNANQSRVDKLRDPSQRVTSGLQATINESRVTNQRVTSQRVMSQRATSQWVTKSDWNCNQQVMSHVSNPNFWVASPSQLTADLSLELSPTRDLSPQVW